MRPRHRAIAFGYKSTRRAASSTLNGSWRRQVADADRIDLGFDDSRRAEAGEYRGASCALDQDSRFWNGHRRRREARQGETGPNHSQAQCRDTAGGAAEACCRVRANSGIAEALIAGRLARGCTPAAALTTVRPSAASSCAHPELPEVRPADRRLTSRRHPGADMTTRRRMKVEPVSCELEPSLWDRNTEIEN